MIDSAPAATLKREIGVVGVIATILNIVIGSGLFVIPGVLGALGTWSVAVIVFCALVMGAVTLSLAEASSRVPAAGGMYGVVRVSLGVVPAAVAGGMIWLSGTLAAAGVLAAAIDQVAPFVSVVSGGVPRAAVLVSLCAAFGLVSHLGARSSARASLVSAVLKLTPLVLVVLLAPTVPAAATVPTPTPALGDAAPLLIIGIYLFAGVESATLMNGEVRDPHRTLPLGYFGALALYAGMAIAVQLAAMHLLGGQLPGARAPLVDGSAAIGSWLPPILALGGVVSMSGCALGLVVAMPRLLYALAQDGLLPSPLGALHPERRTPSLAIVVQTVLIASLAVVGQFGPLAVGASLASMVVYVLGGAAVLQLRRAGIGERGAVSWRITPVAAVVAMVTSTAIIVTAKREALVGLAACCVVFGGYAWWRARATRVVQAA